MNTADLLKGGAVVIILIAALAVFDSYSSHSSSRITGAIITGDSATATAKLASYPAMFMKNRHFDGLVVIRDHASRAEVLASVDIANSLVGNEIPEGTVVFASEVAEPFAQNVISVGNGCINPVTRQIQGKFHTALSNGCYNSALGVDTGAITLYEFGNGKVGLVLEGYAEADLRRAASVLRSYKDWKAAGQLKGTGILVEKLTKEGGTKLKVYSFGSSGTATMQPQPVRHRNI